MQELTLRQVQELILETQEDKTLNEMYIHKSPCAENEVGAIFFAINGVPPRGYAIYLPEVNGVTGALHIFDKLGLKRKIIHCKIIDLETYNNNDVWTPKKVMPLIKS